MSLPSACLLCGQVAPDVRMALVHWREPDSAGDVWGAIPRCRDRSACRERVAALGEEWPIVEGVGGVKSSNDRAAEGPLPTHVFARPKVALLVTHEPEPATTVAAPTDAEEVASWFR